MERQKFFLLLMQQINLYKKVTLDSIHTYNKKTTYKNTKFVFFYIVSKNDTGRQ